MFPAHLSEHGKVRPYFPGESFSCEKGEWFASRIINRRLPNEPEAKMPAFVSVARRSVIDAGFRDDFILRFGAKVTLP